MIGIFTALSQSNISFHSVDGLIQKTQVYRQAGFQSGSFPFSSRLRRPYSLSTVKILRRTRTIPLATQATSFAHEHPKLSHELTTSSPLCFKNKPQLHTVFFSSGASLKDMWTSSITREGKNIEKF